MDFSAFLEQAWADHGDAPEAVAQRLEAFTVADAAQVAPVVRLAVHVFAVHLGETERGVALLRSLPADAAVDRGIGTLRWCGGDGTALDALSRDDRVWALSIGSTVFGDRGDIAGAIAALRQALTLADAGLADGSQAFRALAAGANNLAELLEQKADRSADEKAAMVEAARAALANWRVAGGWLEHERAEYRLAASLLMAGEASAAAEAAERCIAICQANDAPAFERFFGHAMLARALAVTRDDDGYWVARDAAMRWLEQVPEDLRHWCEADRAAIDG